MLGPLSPEQRQHLDKKEMGKALRYARLGLREADTCPTDGMSAAQSERRAGIMQRCRSEIALLEEILSDAVPTRQ